MIGKDSKKKVLKTIITFHSPDVYTAATKVDNTSALVEALLARHFGLPITGDSPQAILRRTVLTPSGGLKVPVIPAEPTPPPAPLTTKAERREAYLNLPPKQSTPPPTSKPEKVVEPPLPERPTAPTPPPAPFAPVGAPAVPTTEYAPGSRLCPNCGSDMGTSPHCLNCL